MEFFGNRFRAVRGGILVVVVVCFTGLLAHGQDRNPGGNPGMDPVDPFTADNSPRARAFKQAWRHAMVESEASCSRGDLRPCGRDA